MHIYWYGQTSIKIQDNGVTIAIDPYKEAAIRSPRMAADILLLTSDKLKSAASAISGDKFTIDSPGEYEAKGIFINGVSNNGSGQTFFFLDINGLTVGHLGNISKGELSSKQLEMFENVDILLMPVGERIFPGHNIPAPSKYRTQQLNDMVGVEVEPVCQPSWWSQIRYMLFLLFHQQ